MPKKTQKTAQEEAIKQIKELSEKFKADTEAIRKKTLEGLQAIMREADRKELDKLRRSINN
jgi:hypothetical protein